MSLEVFQNCQRSNKGTSFFVSTGLPTMGATLENVVQAS